MVNIIKNNNSSQAIKDLEYLALQNFKLAHPTVPYSSKQKYSGNNTNGLTSVCHAKLINSMGRRTFEGFIEWYQKFINQTPIQCRYRNPK